LVAAAGLAVPSLIVVTAQAQESSAQTPASTDQVQGTTATDGGSTDYTSRALMIGMVALETSKVAADKAEDAMVKEFAQLEIGEQTAIATVLSATEAGKGLPALSDADNAKIQELTDMQAGPDFDKAYVDAQIEGHNKLLEVQKMLSGESTPTVEVITAKLAEQAVTSHIVMLNHIKEQMSDTA
jgi:predicted outer membrane protein